MRARDKTQMSKSHRPKPIFKNANPNPKTPTPNHWRFVLGIQTGYRKEGFLDSVLHHFVHVPGTKCTAIFIHHANKYYFGFDFI